jgi:hypothetical protein
LKEDALQYSHESSVTVSRRLVGSQSLANKNINQDDCLPLFCARCAAELTPGKGTFYWIKIEAFADPTPPDVTEEDLQGDLRGQIERLLKMMEGMSGQEAMDQIYRRMTIQLCVGCYNDWIENPAD